MKKLLFSIIFFIVTLSAQLTNIKSPSGKLSVDISTNPGISLSVSLNGELVIKKIKIDLEVDNKTLYTNPVIKNIKKREIKEIIKPVVALKEKEITNYCNEVKVLFEGGNSVCFRVYDNGVAYRFNTSINKGITVNGETSEIEFAQDDSVYFPEEDSFHSHNERYYKKLAIAEIDGKRFCSLPALIFKKNGVKIAVTETDLFDYPGMWLKGTGTGSFKAIFPSYPKEGKQTNDRNVKVTGTENFIAKTSGERSFPWRIFAISENDKDLLLNQLPYILAEPSKIKDTDWIKPGKVAWDWFNDNNIYGVGFKSGVNTATYKYFIDFASKYGIEYIILDEGWYKLGDLKTIVPEIDMPELLRYAKEKNVGIILWMSWKTLEDQPEVLTDFEKWGVKGIKVDFMQRDDQPMVNYYYKIAKLAATHKLLVDYHGAYKPSGLHRTYPNVITFEGVRGGEQNKWSDLQTPQHNVTIPFIRMFAGPMDYTPGGMLNATKNDFKISWSRPMVQGTRCHQLAMYVIYESPLQMLCDSPTNYLKEDDAMKFLSAVPVVWDKTVSIDAKVSEYVIMARKFKDDWFVGGMANWNGKEVDLKFDFVGEGSYQADIYQDGPNADKTAIDYLLKSSTITKSDNLKIKMAKGGGFVIRLRKLN